MRNTSRLLTGAILAATVGLGACSDSSGPSTTPLSAANAAEVGDAVASSADLAIAAVNPIVPVFAGGFPLFSTGGRSLGGGLTFAPPASPPENCPSASDLTDTDGDGVPDNAVWTFSSADCTETDIEGNRSVVTGSVTIADPGLTPGYDLGLNALTMQYFESGASTATLKLVMDGDWSLRATSAAIAAGAGLHLRPHRAGRARDPHQRPGGGFHRRQRQQYFVGSAAAQRHARGQRRLARRVQPGDLRADAHHRHPARVRRRV